MWPFLMKLGVAAILGVGLGLVILLQQESYHREIPYDRNWRDSEPNVTLNNDRSSLQRRRKSQKSSCKDEETQRQLLEDQLNSGTAECIICTECLSCTDEVWSCQYCRNIFHLRCISRWAKSDVSRTWTCPVCRKIMNDDAHTLSYYCMCGRVKEPPVIYGVTPHCCGRSCQRGCGNRCHPGPCSRVTTQPRHL